ncbi:exodeoxyribonuclease VII small subunit [Leucobacter sp. OH2974_COT-288]|uniref:Exodeoxyribonuclease 7 small subunit n=1 Tax=Canibacter oris TaxID=1365628 RepID=A0A840DN46_9MICO|nr:exodeoxyribonuclease VII small subunit [Canibacter oris]MBB4070969.1 exodeoxyribonuclease VII small subunit [Canibacter oris]RRD36512.1 exodeoxyribonuclease VII small subunit [Leucobacter sp. OH2974_COT-288]
MAEDLETLSYEQARDELVQIVQQLENGGTTLEQSLALWERGEALARRCESWLVGAKQRLEQARQEATAAAAADSAAADTEISEEAF